MEENKEKQERQNIAKFFYALSFAGQLGFVIVLPILIFAYFGFWLDKKVGGKKLIFIIFVIIGLFSAGWSVYKWLKPLLKD